MRGTGRNDDMAAAVADEARLESWDEARRIIRSVTGAMIDHFEPAAWEVIEAVLPAEYVGEGTPGSTEEEQSVRDFFIDVGDREELGTATAARYARIVAEAIRNRMTPDQVQRLDDRLSDDFLALFESDHRGELTEPDGATPGARIMGSPSEEPERYSSD
ncbi:MAG TPA: DUF2267 domain-containing protein [Acidimicrobiia bacterium]|nr:DUF2267 domain-containing protein [Acidimicrobiia bacterium]